MVWYLFHFDIIILKLLLHLLPVSRKPTNISSKSTDVQKTLIDKIHVSPRDFDHAIGSKELCNQKKGFFAFAVQFKRVTA
jgi:hypothetical protein